MDDVGIHKLEEYVKTMSTIKYGLIDIAKKAVEKTNAEAPKIQKRVHKRFLPIQREIAKEQFEKAVDAFYADYDPIKYKRRSYGQKQGTLYSGWKHELEQELNEYGSLRYDTAADLLDPKNAMTVTRSGSNTGGFFFNQMFFGGWHGGAMTISADKADEWWEHPNPGVKAYWRRYGVKPDGTLHPFGAWYYEPAANFADRHNKTPYEYYEELLEKAEDTRMMPIFEAMENEESEYLADYLAEEIKTGIQSILDSLLE